MCVERRGETPKGGGEEGKQRHNAGRKNDARFLSIFGRITIISLLFRPLALLHYEEGLVAALAVAPDPF